jgi:glutamate/tyrosine decarboxylase-like PLP-dependent enzyme
MPISPDDYRTALDHAHSYAQDWIDSVPDRRVAPSKNADEMLKVFAGALPEHPSDPIEVIDELAENAEPGLMAMPSGRFFGWVIGGTLPAALGADWLVSAWDQNAGMRYGSPAIAAIEETAGAWLLDVLGLPADSDVGFATGGTMANFTGIAAGRGWVYDQVGWDFNAHGFNGAP